MVAALAVSHCLSGPFELLHVSNSLPWLLVICNCLSQFYGVAACLLLSPMVAALAVSHCLSGPLEIVHVSHCLLSLLPVSYCLLYCCWLSLTVSYMVAGCGLLCCSWLSLSLFLLCRGVAACFLLSPMVAGILSLSLLAVSHCLLYCRSLSLTLSYTVECCYSLSIPSY